MPRNPPSILREIQGSMADVLHACEQRALRRFHDSATDMRMPRKDQDKYVATLRHAAIGQANPQEALMILFPHVLWLGRKRDDDGNSVVRAGQALDNHIVYSCSSRCVHSHFCDILIEDYGPETDGDLVPLYDLLLRGYEVIDAWIRERKESAEFDSILIHAFDWILQLDPAWSLKQKEHLPTLTVAAVCALQERVFSFSHRRCAKKYGAYVEECIQQGDVVKKEVDSLVTKLMGAVGDPELLLCMSERPREDWLQELFPVVARKYKKEFDMGW